MDENDKKHYFRLKLQNIPRALEAEITELAFEHSAQGIQEDLEFKQPHLAFEPKAIQRAFASFEIYFLSAPSSDFYAGLTALSPSAKWELFEEQEKDWLEEWKKDFKPFVFAKPYWIVPSWCELPCPEEFAIRIDPGMAFGTGTHATTKMCAYLASRIENLGRVLDLGTGTGVLGILCEKKGASEIIGLDLDPECIRVATQNSELNQCSHFSTFQAELGDWMSAHPEKFNTVIANIVDGVLLSIKGGLIKALEENGNLVLSGILEEREDYFLEEFTKAAPVKLLQRVATDGWVAFHFRHLNQVELDQAES